MTVETAWHWLTTTRYTRWLEDEVERLREENLALRSVRRGFAQGAPPPGLRQAAAPPRTGETPESPRPIRRMPWAVMKQRLEIEEARKALEERR